MGPAAQAALASRTIRLFVSSPFNDLKAERNALQADVFPRLQKHCQANGWSFQAIDLRWGVSTEAALDQSAMRICLAEIARCQVVTPRPNFLVLLGDRYGWRPLPDAVPAAEFDALCKHLPADIVERLLWRDAQSDDTKGWYRLDENAVVPLPDGSGPDRGLYMLQPRTGRFVKDETWSHDVEQPLGAALRHAAQAEWPDPTDPRRLKYEASATEQEIVAGALTALTVPDAHEHVRAFFRRIDLADGTALRDAIDAEPDRRPYKDFIDLLDGDRLDREAMGRLHALKQRLSQRIGHREPEYAARWQDGGPSSDHIEQFVADVYASLFDLIDAQIKKHTDLKPADEEPLRHWAFAERRARDFTGRESDLAVIDAHVCGSGPAPRLIVHGESGTGKSALMAQAALRLRTSRSPTVIARFIGATPASGDARALLEGLCRELGTIYGASNDNLTLDVNRLAVEFRQRLELATAERPLVLFIDALDQLPADSASVLTWLPRQPYPHVRIVVSALPGAVLDALARELPDAPRHALRPMTRDDGRALLGRWLAGVNRRLTPSQTDRVIGSFADTGLPLYLRLAFEAARLWPSHDAAPALSNNVGGVLNALFDRLSADSSHGPLLVNRVLGYLSCARQGLSETELLRLLARDDEYWPHFLARAKHELPAGEDGQPVRQVPVVIWSRLYHELEPYLSWRSAHGATLMTFFHPTTFVPVVQGRFVQSDAERQQRHAAMATFFVGAARSEPPERPWASDDVRGFAECVYHLVYAGELGVDRSAALLTDLAFIAGKVRHGLVFELIADYRLCIGALPEAQQELGEERQRQARLVRWGEEIAEYARRWSRRREIDVRTGTPADEPEPKLPEPPQSLRMWNQDEIDAECHRMLGQPTRLDRLRQFEVFMSGQLYPLKDFGERAGFVAQHAISTHPSGPVHDAAQAMLAICDTPTLFRRWPSGSTGNPKPVLLLTLVGHQHGVRSVALTADARRAVSAEYNETLRVWDLETGQCLRTLEGHGDSINSIAITPDGRRAVLGGEDKTLREWDLETGQCLRTLEGHRGSINGVALTPDGRRAVSGSEDNTLRVWDLKTGQCLRAIEGHRGSINGVALTPDGRRAVSGSEDNTLCVWDLETGQCLRTLEGHRDIVWSVSLTPDGRRAVSGSRDNTLRVWDLDSGRCLHILEGHGGTIWHLGVAVTPDGKRICSGGDDKTLRIWDLASGQCLRTLEGHGDSINSIAITDDGRRAVSGSDALRVWDLESGQRQRSLDSHGDSVNYVAVTTRGRRAVSGSFTVDVRRDGRRVGSPRDPLRVWDLESAQCLRTLEGHGDSINSIAITEDGLRAVSGSDDKTLRVWDLRSGKCLRTLEGHGYGVVRVVLTPDGRRAVSGSRDKTLRVWDLESGQCLHTFKGHSSRVNSVALTPDGRRVVSGSDDTTLRVWDLETGQCLRTLKGQGYGDSHLALTPDGRRAVSISMDKMLRVWDLETGRCLHTLEGHSDWVRSVSLTPDGRRAVSGSDDKTLRVWNLESGGCLSTLRGHSYSVRNIVVVPDGLRAVSGSLDKTLRVWDLEGGQCLALYSFASGVGAVAVSQRGAGIVVGTQNGEVVLLTAARIPTGPSIVIASHSDQSQCPGCGAALPMSPAIAAAIEALTTNLTPEQSSCLSLPDTAFSDPRLLSRCPHCDAPVKFNPFFSDAASG